jgi:hypothetical protein
MSDFFTYYRQYIYLEKPTSINELKIGGFYRMYIYRYAETGMTETYSANHTPLLLIIGKTAKHGGMFYALKINNLPLRRFLLLYDDIQNQSYTKKLIAEIENDEILMSNSLDYTTGAKAILIDKTGRGFYNKIVKKKKDLEKYDTYRTYKKKNIMHIKEVYFNVSKLKARLGFKKYNPNEETE